MTSPSEDADERFSLVIPRQLTDVLPEAPAFAAYEFIVGPLPDNPSRNLPA